MSVQRTMWKSCTNLKKIRTIFIKEGLTMFKKCFIEYINMCLFFKYFFPFIFILILEYFPEQDLSIYF